MAKSVALILCALYTALVAAREPRQYVFTHSSTTSGLLSNQVNTAVQDNEGYMWMGTTDGCNALMVSAIKHSPISRGILPAFLRTLCGSS